MCPECYIDKSREFLIKFLQKTQTYYYSYRKKDKVCKYMSPVFSVGQYQDYSNTKVRKLTIDEIRKYMSEREDESIKIKCRCVE